MKTSKIVQEFRDERSMELYGKPESQLQLGEIQRLNQYIHDWENPEWRPVEIDLYKNLYLVNKLGQIKSIKTNHVLIPRVGKGYLRVNLSANGEVKNVSIHRLVAQAFIPNPENKPQVNHINGKKTCNWVGNLEWATAKENVDHAIRTNLSPRNGVENPNNKLAEEMIHRICRLLEDGLNAVEIDRILHCGIAVPSRIKEKKIWKQISCQYNIPDPVDKRRDIGFKAKMLEMIFNGYSDREISDYMGLPKDNDILGREYVGLFRRRIIKKIENTFGM